LLLGLLVLAGCQSRPTVSTGTGAKEKAFDFFDAIRRKDWPAAYTTVDPASRPGLTTDAFARLAEQYRWSIGFEPEQVFVTACDEQAESATAHIVYVGHSQSRQRHKDGITLRKTVDGWAVVLPANFGR
jgi:hypothetical protein